MNRKSAQKEATHARIVEVASRAIRRSGFDGTGVADIMKEAGLTHGGFYAHFASRDAMLAEATDFAATDALTQSARAAAVSHSMEPLASLMYAYLSKDHRDCCERGCPLAAVGSELYRQPAEVRQVATRRLKELIDLVARQSPDWGSSHVHENAMVTVSAMVGSLILSRGVSDALLSESILQATLDHFAPKTSTKQD